MIRSYKLQSISCNQIFCLLYISRILVSLTYIPSLNFQETKGDLLLAVLLMLPMLLLFFLPVYFYMKLYQNRPLSEVAAQYNPIAGKAVSASYFLWFIFTAALNITRFVYFVTAEMNQNASSFLLIFLVAAAACYGAYLGAQSLGRVAVIILWAMLTSFLFVMLFALKHFQLTNFSPMLEDPLTDTLMNAFNLACNTAELTVLPFLLPRMQEKITKKPITVWSAGLVALIFSLYFVSIGTQGYFARTQSFPIYSMSQISGVGILQRLDAVHTSIWIVALLLKTAIFLVAANTALQGVFPKLKVPWSLGACAVLTIGAAFGMSLSFPNYWKTSNRWFSIIPFLLFALVIPAVFVFLKKKKKEGTSDASLAETN